MRQVWGSLRYRRGGAIFSSIHVTGDMKITVFWRIRYFRRPCTMTDLTLIKQHISEITVSSICGGFRHST